MKVRSRQRINRRGKGALAHSTVQAAIALYYLGVTHYSYGEGALAHSTVQERKSKRLAIPMRLEGEERKAGSQ